MLFSLLPFDPFFSLTSTLTSLRSGNLTLLPATTFHFFSITYEKRSDGEADLEKSFYPCVMSSLVCVGAAKWVAT